jgi:hypothetical protein
MEALEIGKQIITRINLETYKLKPQRAKGYIKIKDKNGNLSEIWLINDKELGKGHYVNRNIVGFSLGTEIVETPYLKQGIVVSKNSPIGNALQDIEGLGEILHRTPTGVEKKYLIARAGYEISREQDDAVKGYILSKTEPTFPFEESLRIRLKEMEDFLQKEEQIKISEDQDKIKQLRIERDALKELISKKQITVLRYRRTEASLKQNFLLGPEQNLIKRTNLLNGSLIINGGPGTGKTTLLIHRLQYLIDPLVEEDENFKVKLSNEQRNYIRSQKTGWIFFSPTTLLKKYLENAMVAEGLAANDENVKTWEQQKNILKTGMVLIDASSRRLFQQLPNQDPLWKLSGKNLKDFNLAFDNFLIAYFKVKFVKLSELKLSQFTWHKEGLDIGATLDFKRADIPSLIKALNTLMEKYRDLLSSIEKDYKELMREIADNVQSRFNDVENEWFKERLKERRDTTKYLNDDEENDDDEDLTESFDEEEVLEGKLIIDINRLIKRVVRNQALSTVDKNTKVRTKDAEILAKIDAFIDKQRFSEIASHSMFLKYFKPFVKGADFTILKQLPRIYKQFRKTVIPGLPFLNKSIKISINQIISTNPVNNKIHNDELDFLILQGLRLAKEFYITAPQVFRSSNNSILTSYSANLKGLVAVDECTDFTITQLECMHQLCLPRVNSITLAGDLMQQMNEMGIKDWADLKSILPGAHLAELKKSYRQTPALLKIATRLYKSRYGLDPGFYSEKEDTHDEPLPLFIINDDFNHKIDWISQRIIEVFDVYDRIIPNIAIFAKDQEMVSKVADALKKNELLLTNGIEVKACLGESDLGSADFVRVFKINLIKGMEFETVFFIDVDTYYDDEIAILDKLIYVGVSRATYYLGITLEKVFPSSLISVKELFFTGNWNKNIERDY